MLLKAAAGAGKSYALRRMVGESIEDGRASRVAVVAFTNKQIHPLAVSLGKELGKDKVCIFVKRGSAGSLPDEVHQFATVAEKTPEIPTNARVVIATCHKLGATGEFGRQKASLGAGRNGSMPYDVLFVDEAWQIPHHLFDKVRGIAPLWVGVGDVGQLPPLEIGSNPWRGRPEATTPTAPGRPSTTAGRPHVVEELPAVWRPSAGHLALWRAFYPEWARAQLRGRARRPVDRAG